MLRYSATRCAVVAVSLILAAGSSLARADVTGSAGGVAPVDNNQPSLVMPMFITTQGIFGMGVPIRIFAYSPTQVAQLVPPFGNWVPCDGRSLPRSSNGALFSQLSTTYGADDGTTFKVPDLRGRAVMGEGWGTYPFAQAYTRAQTAGVSQYTLTGANLPQHDHVLGFGSHHTDLAGAQFPSSIDTMQPSTAMNYVISTGSAFFPQRDDGSGNGGAVGPSDSYYGQIQLMAATPEANWHRTPCDGRLIDINTNTALFSICGNYYGGNGTVTFALPDLRGRVSMGQTAGGAAGITPHPLASYTGERLVGLTAANLPDHTHSASGFVPPETGHSGGGQGYQNTQPSLPLTYGIALNGVYPSSGGMDDQWGYVGEIILFAGNFTPLGYVPCDGRALDIANNDVLFALIGFTYGTGGPGTFRIPDLRGRTPIAPSSVLAIGQAFGTEQTVMSVSQMPAHTHTYTNCPADLGVQGGNAGHDGVYDNNDFIAFIELFFAHSPQADLGIQGGIAGHDGAWDNNDFVAFIDAFFAGCL